MASSRFLKTVALTSAIVFSAMHAHAQQPGSIITFRDEVVAAIKSRAPTSCVRVLDSTTLNIGPSEDDCGGFLAVENQYNEVVRGADRAIAIERLVRLAVMSNAPSDISAADRARIVVVLRPVDYGSEIPTPKPLELVSRTFAGDLMAALMFDSEETLRGMTPADLERVGLSETDAFSTAAENLRKRIGPVDTEKVGDIDVTSANSGLATGLLALPETCNASSADRFYLVFDKNSYASVPMRNRRSIQQFLNMAERMGADGASMSRTAIACQSGLWRAAKDVAITD